MSTINVENISKAVFKNPTYGIVIGQVVVLLEVSVLIKVDGGVVRGQHMQVDGLAVVLSRSGDVLLQTVQQKRACEGQKSRAYLSEAPASLFMREVLEAAWDTRPVTYLFHVYGTPSPLPDLRCMRPEYRQES